MRDLIKTLLLCLVSALIAVFCYRYIDTQAQGDKATLARLVVDEKPFVRFPKGREVDPVNLYPNFINASSKVTSTVVNIKAINKNALNELWSGIPSTSNSGSGVIISNDGYIVTNNHVVTKGKAIKVTLENQEEFTAKIVGTDPSTDLAVLKIDAVELPFLNFGNSDSLYVGEWVLAVGNPFDLQSTVTAGIVSAKGRSIDILEDRYSIESFIQTDAAVNPGNSGGALVNTQGDLMGIITAILTRSGRYEGYSFAIPSSLAAKIVTDLIEFGDVQRAVLGIDFEKISGNQAIELGLPMSRGILIQAIKNNSGAEKAKLQINDVIVKVEETPIGDVPAFKETIGRYRPGDTIQVSFYRDGTLQEAKVELANSKEAWLSSELDKGLLSKLGFEAKDLSAEEKSRSPKGGVRVISIYLGSKIDRTKMDPDYIITKVNGDNIKNTKDLVEKLKSIQEGKDVMLEGYYENFAGEYYYAFKR